MAARPYDQINSPFFDSLQEQLNQAASERQLFEAIVNAPFRHPVQTTLLDLGIIVLLLVNRAKLTIDRIALSDTEHAEGAVKMSEKPFRSIKIPLGHTANIIAKAIATGRPTSTADWPDLFVPVLSPQAARFNQSGAGIECSFVFPFTARDSGALIFSYYQPRQNIGPLQQKFMHAYTDMVDKRLR